METGTNVGRSVKQALNAGFKTIHSIEISNKIAHWTTQTFKNHSNVHIWQGDSGSILYDVIKDIDAPITFWLDASDGTQELKAENIPIMRELEAIKRHHIKNHTLLIDDVGCAGTRAFDFITKESIIAKIKEINPNYVIRYIAGGDDAECPNNIMVAQVPESRSPYLDPAITSKIDKNEVNQGEPYINQYCKGGLASSHWMWVRSILLFNKIINNLKMIKYLLPKVKYMYVADCK